MSVKDITKKELRVLNKVIFYRKRTLGFLFLSSPKELEEKWREAQIELGSEYQYSGKDDNIWDYYLILICAFDVDNLESTVRFEIENDKFCCRKYIIYNMTEEKWKAEEIVKSIFPQLKVDSRIEMLKPENFVSEINKKIGIDLPLDFFIKNKKENEIRHLLSELLKAEK